MAKTEVIFVDEETLTPEEWEVMLSGETEEADKGSGTGIGAVNRKQ